MITEQKLREFVEASETVNRIESLLSKKLEFGRCEAGRDSFKGLPKDLEDFGIMDTDHLENSMKAKAEEIIYRQRIEIAGDGTVCFEKGSSLKWLIQLLGAKG